MKESGLIDEWKMRTFRQMRINMIERGEKPVEEEKRSTNSPLTMDDLQGIFYVKAILLGLATIVFFWEMRSS